MKPIFYQLGIGAAFMGGYFLNSMLNPEVPAKEYKEKAPDKKEKKAQPVSDDTGTARVTGIGGIFFKSKDPEKLKEWYATHFGMPMDEYGTNFAWYQGADASQKGFTLWAPFTDKTKYFDPSQKEFMINYRVKNLEELLQKLRAENILPVDSVEKTEYGNFVHLMDPEGNKIELWEPIDAVYDTIINARTQ